MLVQKVKMKIVGITMLTDPDYRQDPWRECLRQMLEVCDEAVVVVGQPADIDLVGDFCRQAGIIERVEVDYLHWPQPGWDYSELPFHLNRALELARARGADWIIKFDADCFIHENDAAELRHQLGRADEKKASVATFVKLQFFLVDRACIKTQVPFAVRGKSDVWYGKNQEKYTDLCQPIILPANRDNWHFEHPAGTANPIPVGPAVPRGLQVFTGVFVWNYDYSFKTEERSKELLYEFDRSHAKFWGVSYAHRQIQEVTPETALADYLKSVAGPRIKKCTKRLQPDDHPKWIRERVRNIRPEEFGHSLWNKIKYEL